MLVHVLLVQSVVRIQHPKPLLEKWTVFGGFDDIYSTSVSAHCHPVDITV